MPERCGRTMTVRVPGTDDRLSLVRDYGQREAMYFATVRIRVRSDNRKRRDLWQHLCAQHMVNATVVEETGLEDRHRIYGGRYNPDGTPFIAPHSTTYDVSGDVVALSRLIGYPKHVLIIDMDWASRRVYSAPGAGDKPRFRGNGPIHIDKGNAIDAPGPRRI